MKRHTEPYNFSGWNPMASSEETKSVQRISPGYEDVEGWKKMLKKVW